MSLWKLLWPCAASIVEPARLRQVRLDFQLRACVRAQLPPCTYSSLNLQYDVGLRLSHKSGAIVSSPPTRDGLCNLVSRSQLCGHSGSGYAAPIVPGKNPASNRR